MIQNLGHWCVEMVKTKKTKKAASSRTRNKKNNDPGGILGSGKKAPNFSLHSTPDQLVSLSDFRGRPVILAFYPADWSPVCTDQMSLYNQVLPEFQRYNAEIFGISVDGSWCHLAFAQGRNLQFSLLSDFEPKGKVAAAYGAYNKRNGEAERALFVIDDTGMIRWSYLSPDGVNPGADGILDALDRLYPDKQTVTQTVAVSQQ
jgi:peroxiredoxin